MSQSASAKAKQILQRKEKDIRPGSSSNSQSTHDTRLSRQRATTPAGACEVSQTGYDEARQHLSKARLLETTEPCNPQTMSIALKMLATSTTKIPADVEKAINCLSEVIEKMEIQCTECPKVQALPDQIKEACLSIHKGLTEQITEMERNLSTKLAGQIDIHTATGKIDEAIEKLGKAMTEVEAKLTEVSGTASQIASKANTYKEALLSNPALSPARSPESDMARVASEAADKLERQVLFEVDSDELLAQSDVAVREKANQAIKQVTSPLAGRCLHSGDQQSPQGSASHQNELQRGCKLAQTPRSHTDLHSQLPYGRGCQTETVSPNRTKDPDHLRTRRQ